MTRVLFATLALAGCAAAPGGPGQAFDPMFCAGYGDLVGSLARDRDAGQSRSDLLRTARLAASNQPNPIIVAVSLSIFQSAAAEVFASDRAPDDLSRDARDYCGATPATQLTDWSA